MSFDRVISESFAGAVGEEEFCRRVAGTLQPLGFTKDSTLACIATCRDEISQSWVEATTACWGHAFNLSALAGMSAAGKTGLGAALAHGPNAEGRERYLFSAGPHIGVNAAGEAGLCEREGRAAPSGACGALVALLNELKSGKLGPTDDPDDVEQGLLRRRLGGRAAGEARRDLIALTKLAHDVIAEDLERLLDAVVDTAKADYAVVTGIQIHGPGMRNYVHPGVAFAVIGAARRPLQLA